MENGIFLFSGHQLTSFRPTLSSTYSTVRLCVTESTYTMENMCVKSIGSLTRLLCLFGANKQYLYFVRLAEGRCCGGGVLHETCTVQRGRCCSVWRIWIVRSVSCGIVCGNRKSGRVNRSVSAARRPTHVFLACLVCCPITCMQLFCCSSKRIGELCSTVLLFTLCSVRTRYIYMPHAPRERRRRKVYGALSN